MLAGWQGGGLNLEETYMYFATLCCFVQNFQDKKMKYDCQKRDNFLLKI